MLRMNYPLRSLGAILYRADIIKQIGGFARELRTTQDLDLNFRVARAHPICCNDSIVTLTRRHDSMSRSDLAGMLRDAVRAQRRQRAHVRRLLRARLQGRAEARTSLLGRETEPADDRPRSRWRARPGDPRRVAANALRTRCGRCDRRGMPAQPALAQAYYWSRAWQQGEAESLAELQAGHGRVFHDTNELARTSSV